jgi:ribokinase
MIAVIGSINMDLVMQTERIPRPGETILGDNFKQIPGGKGANQASAAAKLGAAVKMIGCVGDDAFGTTLKDALTNYGVNTDHVLVEPNVASGVAIITVEQSGNNCIIIAPGANYCLTDESLKEAEQTICNSDVVMIQLEIPIATVKTAILIAKSAGKTVILNPAPAAELDEEILKNIDILTPNETELEILSGHKTETLEDIKTAGEIMLNKGVKELVITLGSMGCLHMNHQGSKKYDAYKVKAVDTTAAGDAFNGALAVYLSEGKTIGEAIDFAMKVGAMTVTKHGAQPSLPLISEVLDFDKWIKTQST